MRTTSSSYLQHFPELSRYYGLSFSELMRLPRVFVKQYVDALPRLKAEEQLRDIASASFPHMTDAGRRSLIRSLEREIGPTTPDPVRVGDWQQHAAGMGITVEMHEEVSADA